MLKVLRTRNVKLPTRGTEQSAGYDFYIPVDFKTVELKPGDAVLIPSGIKCKIPWGYALIAFNKSGIATKKGLMVGASVVDADYQGEVHIHLINTSNKNVTLNPNEKIVQFILIPVLMSDVNEVGSEEELFGNKKTDRGEGGFGSTNHKPKDIDDRPKLSGTTACVIAIGSESESRISGTYKRHTFRDIKTGETYLLDVSHLCPQFKGLGIGDVLTNLQIFKNERTGKNHINGKVKPVKLGLYKDIKDIIENKITKKQVGFTI